MTWLPDKLWARILVIGAYFVIGYCLLRASGIILPALAPFIVAWIAAALLQKPISRISCATAVSRKIISVAVTAFFLFVLSFIAFLISRRLLSEAGRLVSVIGEKSGDVIEKISDFISGNADKLSVGIFGDKITNKMITDGITDSISSVIASASSKVASFFASLVSSVPEILLFTAGCIAATFYFTVDYYRIRAFISRLLPFGARMFAFSVKKHSSIIILEYIRAAGIIMLVTFCEMFVGFLLLGVDYVILLSLLVAFVDFLPVLGVGTVLCPWGVFCLLSGNTAKGLGLFALWGISELIRTFIEPKIVSASVGLHPVATLISIYCGYRFIGVTGMILCPIAVTCAVRCFEAESPIRKSVRQTE